MFKMHKVGTVPTYKTHNVGTVPTFKMQNVGTVSIYRDRAELCHTATLKLESDWIGLNWKLKMYMKMKTTEKNADNWKNEDDPQNGDM